MKVLLINGSPREKGCTYTALMEAVSVFEKNGVFLWGKYRYRNKLGKLKVFLK